MTDEAMGAGRKDLAWNPTNKKTLKYTGCRGGSAYNYKTRMSKEEAIRTVNKGKGSGNTDHGFSRGYAAAARLRLRISGPEPPQAYPAPCPRMGKHTIKDIIWLLNRVYKPLISRLLR